MVSAIVLDTLLVIILMMVIPLGFLRGGLREVCTGAGLLLGILLAMYWSGRWGNWLAALGDFDTGTARFLVAILVVVLVTSLIGYGGTAAFSYQPSPGGRLFGAGLALLNGIVFVGYLINQVVEEAYDGQLPAAVESGFISRAFSVGFEWVLLVGALGVLGAAVFGMLIRERAEGEFTYSTVVPHGASALDHPKEAQTAVMPSINQPGLMGPAVEFEGRQEKPVRIREVRHWEEKPEVPNPRRDYEAGWRQTWPDPKKGPAFPWEQQPAPRLPANKRPAGPPASDEEGTSNQRQVLRDWMKGDGPQDDR